MTNLILPPHIVAKQRPYAAALLEDLLKELQERKVAIEFSAEISMPAPVEIAEMKLDEAQLINLRHQITAQLFSQLPAAIYEAGFALVGSGHRPPDLREVVVVKLIVLRHPMLPAPVANDVAVPAEGAV